MKRTVIKGRKLKAGERSLRYLRKQGYTAEVTERFVTYGGTQAKDEYIRELLGQRLQLLAKLRRAWVGKPERLSVLEEELEPLTLPEEPKGLHGVRKDLYGFVDILAYKHDGETIAVQTTSRQQITAHLRKYRGDEDTRQKILDWLAQPGRAFVIHGWICEELPTKAGGTKARWRCEERKVTSADLTEAKF